MSGPRTYAEALRSYIKGMTIYLADKKTEVESLDDFKGHEKEVFYVEGTYEREAWG